MRLDESEQQNKADAKINDLRRQLIVAAFLMDEYKVIQIDGSLATIKISPSPGMVHGLVNAIFPDRPISISTVRRVLATERQRQPELFALARDKPRSIDIRKGIVAPRIRANEQSSLSAPEHIALKRAVLASIEQKLAHVRGEFDTLLKGLGHGQPVIDVITGEVKFVR
jgi:hypothetical protein